MPELPASLTPRQALLALVTDKFVPPLYARWQEWSAGERQNVDQEVVKDLGLMG
jgi:hypothetical protein